MTAPRVVALDLSLTRSGVALPDGSVHVLRPTTRGCERLAWIREAVTDHVLRGWPYSECVADLVAIEGFSYGSKNQRSVHEIGGLGWVIRLALHEAGVPYVEVPPATLKKYATGRGNADKQAMQMAAVKRLGYDDDNPDDNAIDALFLRALALDAYGYPPARMPKVQRDRAVAAVNWPTLDGWQVQEVTAA